MRRALAAFLLLGFAAVGADHASLSTQEVFLGAESSDESVLLAPQVTLGGQPLATVRDVPEPEACSAQCRQEPHCLAFNYCQEEVGRRGPRPPSPPHAGTARLVSSSRGWLLLPAGHPLPGRQQHHAGIPRVPAAQL